MAVQKLGQAIEFDLAFGLLRFASICSCATVPCIGGGKEETGVLLKVLLQDGGGCCNGERHCRGFAQGSCRDKAGDGQKAVS